jgi:hypothetical protein
LKDPNESELVENLGEDIPIGSKENVKYIKNTIQIYLNEGKGDP